MSDARGYELLSPQAKLAATELGGLVPTRDPLSAAVCARTGDKVVVYHADDLLRIAHGLAEIASYLKCRARDAKDGQ